MTAPLDPAALVAAVRQLQHDLDRIAARYAGLHEWSYSRLRAFDLGGGLVRVQVGDPTSSAALDGFGTRPALRNVSALMAHLERDVGRALAALQRANRAVLDGSRVGRTWTVGELAAEERRAWERRRSREAAGH